MWLVLATHNKHKIDEISAAFAALLTKRGIDAKNVRITSLLDDEVVLPPETGSTFEENSRGKAVTVYEFFRARKDKELPWVLGDDSGLVVSALGGAPGLYSSRYSGEPVDYDRNNRKLLNEMENVPSDRRDAYFICSMVLISPEGKEYAFEGRMHGVIAREISGGKGFGYDPVFFVPEHAKTVAELPFDLKNEISHRGRATEKVLEFLVEFLKS